MTVVDVEVLVGDAIESVVVVLRHG